MAGTVLLFVYFFYTLNKTTQIFFLYFLVHAIVKCLIFFGVAFINNFILHSALEVLPLKLRQEKTGTRQ